MFNSGQWVKTKYNSPEEKKRILKTQESFDKNRKKRKSKKKSKY